MLPGLICSITNKTRLWNVRAFITLSKKINSNSESYNSRPCKSYLQHESNLITIKRFKKSSKKQKDIESDSEDESSDSDEESQDELDSTGSKVITGYVTSPRMENVLKIALGLSRRKVEDAFYQGKIRVNGHPTTKKSTQLNVGDEVDIILLKKPKNPNLLLVHRAKLLNMSVKDDKISIQVMRDKNLLVEDYENS